MDKLLSSRYKDESLPDKYILPPQMRPGNVAVASCRSINPVVPVIDLDDRPAQRVTIAQQILNASQDFGFFQVINHEVPRELMNEAMSVFKEVFQMRAEDQASIYSEDPSRSCRLFTSSIDYLTKSVHYWHDSLRHPCHPELEECIQQWPPKPNRYRQVVGTYVMEVMKLASKILELISEGLGLEPGYFGGKLSESSLLSINNYPPCPDPSLTLGLFRHCDPNLLTILLQVDVCGLQVFKDGEWIAVISNSKLKSVEHRAVTNSRNAKTSAAFFVGHNRDSIIQPAKDLISVDSPQVYRAFEFKEFFLNYQRENGNTGVVLEPFKLQA